MVLHHVANTCRLDKSARRNARSDPPPPAHAAGRVMCVHRHNFLDNFLPEGKTLRNLLQQDARGHLLRALREVSGVGLGLTRRLGGHAIRIKIASKFNEKIMSFWTRFWLILASFLGPLGRPRRAKIGPRGAQERPNRRQDRSKTPQDRLRKLQDRSRKLLDADFCRKCRSFKYPTFYYEKHHILPCQSRPR